MAYITDDELFNLQQLHRMAAAQVVCVIIYWWFLRRRLKRKRLEDDGNGHDGDYGDRSGDDIHNVNISSFDTSSFSPDRCSQQSDASSKKAKGKAKIDKVEILRDGLKSVADAIEASIRKYRLPIEEDEVAAVVLELGIEDSLFDECYLFLVDNPNKLRALLGLPMIRRKSFLMRMVFGANPPHPPTFPSPPNF